MISMTKKSRNFLFILFVLFFLILAPLSIFYATGYKINFSWPIKLNSALQKTGMLILETEPGGARIYLNNEGQQLFLDKLFSKKDKIITTPAKIKGLLPGEYEVRLEMDGYWSWQRRLTINPGLSTIWKDIKLFKKSLPLQIIELSQDITNDKKNISFSPDGSNIAYIENNKVTIYNTNSTEKNIVNFNNTSTQKEENILWSPDNEKLIYNNIIINSDKNIQPVDLRKIIGSGIYNVKWGENSNNIYYQYQNSINFFDLGKRYNQQLLTGENIKDFLINEEKIILINEKNSSVKLQVFSIADKKIQQNIELPFSPEYKILNHKNKFIHLYDVRHEILYLIDFSSSISPLKEIINNIKYIVWIEENQLLYANDYEIWLLNLQDNSLFSGNNKKTLLTRISKKITNIAWHPSNNHVLYSTTDSINIIDLSNQKKKNLTELIKLENIFNVIFFPENDTVYFTAKIGNKEGIYKLEL